MIFTCKIIFAFGDHIRSARFCHVWVWWYFRESLSLMHWWIHHWALYNHHIVSASSFLYKMCWEMQYIFKFWSRTIWQIPTKIPTFYAPIFTFRWQSKHTASYACLTLLLFHSFACYLPCGSIFQQFAVVLECLVHLSHLGPRCSSLYTIWNIFSVFPSVFSVAGKIWCYPMVWYTLFPSTNFTLLGDISHQRV
jgi:hypothetical protein